MSETTNTENKATSTDKVPTAGLDKLPSVKWNECEIVLHRLSTSAREGKQSVAYWGLVRDDLIVSKIVDKDGNKVVQTDTTATLDHMAKMFGGVDRLIDDIVLPKVNQNIKATQLSAGKDTFSMDDKADYAKAYILADWGLTSRGGGGIVAAMNMLRQSNMELTARLAFLGSRIVDPTVSAEDKVKHVAEMQSISAQMQILNQPKEPKK